MAHMKITEAQAQRLLKARTLASYQRKSEKKAVFAEIRRTHGIPSSTKMKLAVENPDNPLYLVIRNKRTGAPLDNGIPDVKPTIAAKPAPTPELPAAAVTVAKKAPAKKAAPAKKVVAKKPAVKAVAKKAAPAKKVVAKKPAAKVAVKKPVAKTPAKAVTKKPAVKAAVKKAPAKKAVVKKSK